jgi:hypothetical protein
MEHTSQACSLPLQYNWLCRVVSSLHSIKLGQIPKGKAAKIHEPRTIGKQKNFKRDVIYLLTQCRSSVRMGNRLARALLQLRLGGDVEVRALKVLHLRRV